MIPKHLKKLFDAVENNTASAHRCIKAMCHVCLNYNLADIKTCTSKKCPLYNFRPGAKRKINHNPNIEGLKKYRNSIVNKKIVELSNNLMGWNTK